MLKTTLKAVRAMLVAATLSYSFLAAASQPELSADELVEKASLSAYYGGQDGKSLARMKIVDAAGREQLRQFTILRKDVSDGGDQLFLLVFARPADVKDTVFLVHKKPQGEDDRWLYLPALDLVKRISAGDKRTSFVGAHYFYEDISGRSPQADQHELISATETHYRLKHTPKNQASVEFSYYQTWIDKSNFLPTKIEFYDASNKAYRLIEALEVETVQGIATVTKAKVTNLSDASYTILEFKGMTYDVGLTDDIFTERSLRNPPLQWLKR